MMQLEASFIVRTGQTWKVATFVIGEAVCAAVLFSLPPGASSTRLFVDFATIVIGIGIFLWAALVVKCPECQSRFFWRAMREKPVSTWLLEALLAEECPGCGHLPRARE